MKKYYFVTLSENGSKALCTLKPSPSNVIEYLRGGGTYLYESSGFIFEDVFTKKTIYSDVVRSPGTGTTTNRRGIGHITYKIDSEYVPDDSELKSFLASMTGEELKKYKAMMNELENNAIEAKKQAKRDKQDISETISELTGSSRR